jgi:retinol dehydrogenase-12
MPSSSSSIAARASASTLRASSFHKRASSRASSSAEKQPRRRLRKNGLVRVDAKTTSAQTKEDKEDDDKRIVLITGGNTGLGFISAKEIAAMSDEFKVVIACRSVERGEKAMKDNVPEFVDVMECDLSSFASVRRFAEAFKKKYARLDVLMNNAGIMALPERIVSEDGNELQMQTNHFSHFMLTAKLLPLMFDTERRHPERKPRVVNVASIAHEWGFIDNGNMNSEGVLGIPALGYPGWGWITYGRTKMANVLFTYELQRKLKKVGSKMQAYCVHPGVVDTELQRNLPIDWYVNLREAGRLINPPEGAKGQIYVATSKELENDEGGKYSSELSNEGKPGEHAFRPSNAFSLDTENWARVWKESERITGVDFDSVFSEFVVEEDVVVEREEEREEVSAA